MTSAAMQSFHGVDDVELQQLIQLLSDFFIPFVPDKSYPEQFFFNLEADWA